MEKPIELGDTKRRSGLTDLQNLTPTLINTVLDAMGIKYERNNDGIYELILPNDTVMVLLSLPEPSEICINCAYTSTIPAKNWMKAFLACNEFHCASKFGHAYFVPNDNKEIIFIYKLHHGFENGMVSEEYLIRTIVQAIEHAGDVFTRIEQWCSS